MLSMELGYGYLNIKGSPTTLFLHLTVELSKPGEKCDGVGPRQSLCDLGNICLKHCTIPGTPSLP